MRKLGGKTPALCVAMLVALVGVAGIAGAVTYENTAAKKVVEKLVLSSPTCMGIGGSMCAGYANETCDATSAQPCIAKLTETSSSTKAVSWSATVVTPAGFDQSEVSVSPSSGTLSPGHTVDVKVTDPDGQCSYFCGVTFFGSQNYVFVMVSTD